MEKQYWQHNLDALVGVAGLSDARNADFKANATFAAFWGCVKDWNERSRYEERSEQQARDLFEAIANEPDGVLSWLKRNW